MTLAWIGFHFATHCNAEQRTTNAATRCVLWAYNAAKHDCGRGSGWWSLQRSPRSPSRFQWAALRREAEGNGWKGNGGEEKGKNGEGQGGRGRGGEERLTLMRSWNRAADWLRPALLSNHHVTRFAHHLLSASLDHQHVPLWQSLVIHSDTHLESIHKTYLSEILLPQSAGICHTAFTDSDFSIFLTKTVHQQIFCTANCNNLISSPATPTSSFSLSHLKESISKCSTSTVFSSYYWFLFLSSSSLISCLLLCRRLSWLPSVCYAFCITSRFIHYVSEC